MLRLRFHPILLAALLVAVALPAAAQQQNSGSAQQTTPQTSSTSKKKQDKKKKKSEEKPAQQNPAPQPEKPAAQQNPFPEAESEKAAHQAQQQNPPSAPAPQTKRSTAEENPFPEAESEKAAREAQQRQSAEPGNSSSSAVPGLNLPTKPSKKPAPVLNPSLGAQDTKVGDFYRQSGNWKGAYDRFLEATQVDPSDAEAVFGLADSARHLGLRKVAIQNFQLYLTALPNGPRAKDARKALKEMGVRQ